MIKKIVLTLTILYTFVACETSKTSQETTEVAMVDNSLTSPGSGRVRPTVVTEKVGYDSDDPAIWINKEDPSKSLVIGTDKGNDDGIGGLFVFDLEGKIVGHVDSIARPNNVDVAYNFKLGSQLIDIAVCTERYTNKIRAFKLPEMTPVDNGGIDVFKNEEHRAPMGIALYTNPQDSEVYAIVGRKYGPEEKYLWQYHLQGKNGTLTGEVVRKFGKFSGVKEIEAIAVDNELGYIYYSDENTGIRKYYAHPDSSDVEIALFGTEGFADDNEGISIYKETDSTGYILISDQQANLFHIFSREGSPEDPNQHKLIKKVWVSTNESDGSDVTSMSLNDTFSKGLFVAMSDDGTFQYYKCDDIINHKP